MTQGSFNWNGTPPHETHAHNHRRVKARIGGAIVDFIESRLREGRPIFTTTQLLEHVESMCAPVRAGSPDRILRALRQDRVIDYELISRAAGLYRAIRVLPP